MPEGSSVPHVPKVRTGKRVAVVGSGPAGLAAADQLNRRGHTVTVFERADRIGGLLMYGIPNMKLEKAVVRRRAGPDGRRGRDLPYRRAMWAQDVAAQELLAQYDAVILCLRSQAKPRDLAVTGREVKGIHFAVDFLTSTTKSPAGHGAGRRARIWLRQGQGRGHCGGRRHGQRLRGHLHPPRLQAA